MIKVLAITSKRKSLDYTTLIDRGIVLNAFKRINKQYVLCSQFCQLAQLFSYAITVTERNAFETTHVPVT